MRFVGVHIDHPSEIERERGAQSRVSLAIDRGLRSGKLDVVPLDEDDLVRLIAQAGARLATLRGVRS